MKKTLLSAVAVFAFCFSAQAQQDDFPVFGIKGGVNFSNFGADADTDSTTGFYAGVLVDIPGKGNFHFQPEILYTSEGAKDSSLDYIRIPVMGKYYLTQGLSIQAGPELAVKIGAEDKDVNRSTRNLDYGVEGGLAYEFGPGIFIDARYYLGLANIYDSVDNEQDMKFTNNSIRVGIGFRF
ncbi:porin family protein [Flavobacterium rhizosphaerae]|uniref:Porin family protein n=1 Tax=Flavobacterium rhizosphaerae TaxID=3163298 RepID=A0ABW8YUW2_9FLAO